MQHQPLADRIRPKTPDEMVGQTHLFGENGALRRMLARNYLPNLIFFGPPGTGKTTAANLIASLSGRTMRRLNATTASIQDVKDVIAETETMLGADGILLYLDEIQYFNKKQQQSLLECLEDGRITLIASTTENPYLYVYNAILSRSAVFQFHPVEEAEITKALARALAFLNRESGTEKTAEDGALTLVARCAAGDVRCALNLLESLYYTSDTVLTRDGVLTFRPDASGNFDREGPVHYELLSALQKSVRGSDPDAAIFYLARILEGGDLIGACRRLLVMASEDIGLAYPLAPAVVKACVDAAMQVGMPEASIPLSDAVLLLATAPKSNSAHAAYERAAADVRAGKGRNTPAILQPADNFTGYRYPHDYPNHWVAQTYLPADLAGTVYYEFGENKTETAARTYWEKIRKG